jgi:hypothetical protein
LNAFNLGNEKTLFSKSPFVFGLLE